jgi:hypothetical protein
MDQAPSGRDLPSPLQRPPFAVRHPFLVHGVLVLVCWSAYGFDRVDVVWRFIRDSGHAQTLEHYSFALAALLIGLGIWLGAWPSGRGANLAFRNPNAIRRRSLGEILHAIGIASLLPVAGALLLILGESIRSTLYARWKIHAFTRQSGSSANPSLPAASSLSLRFFARYVSGICAFLSMLIFSITLRDHQADALFATTAVVFVVSRLIDVR